MRNGKDNHGIQRKRRSLMACAKCRRSKVKCVNNGLGSKCVACTGNGIDCRYLSVSGSTPKRRESSAKIKQQDDESPERVKKFEDPLDATVLTQKVWDEVFDIFKLHFSTQLPFFHPPTFRNRIRQASNPRDPSVAPTDLRHSGVLLLAVLMLTARFHPVLVDYHSTAESRNPLDASEYYATALKTAIGPTGLNITSSFIEGIQALLMLALYECGQTRDLSAWIFSSIAIRIAQAIKLPHEEDEESHCSDAIEREVRRRTWWSCFILDRMFSAGKYMPPMISIKQMKVKLPCFDDQFLFVGDEPARFWDEPLRANEIVNDDRVLGRYIRLVEIFGKLTQWKYAGGRTSETLPPWHSATQFSELLQELERFYNNLPSSLTFNKPNLSAHIENRNATTYTSMHTLYSQCLIMLHREYTSYIPPLHARPQRPLDILVPPENQTYIACEFWEKSAVAIFSAARGIVEIVQICQDHNALPELPQIEFAVSQAAFVFLFAAHFQHMDVGDYVHLQTGQSNDDHWTEGYMDLSFKILGNMIPRLNMAKVHLELLGKMRNYLSNADTEVQRRSHQNWSTIAGFKAYENFEKEFGSFYTMFDSCPVCSRIVINNIGKESANRDAMQAFEARPKSATISVSPTSEDDKRRDNQNQRYQWSINPQQSFAQNPTLPSFISPDELSLIINPSYAQHAHNRQLLPHLSQNPHYPTALGEPRQEVNIGWRPRQEGINASGCDNSLQPGYTERRFDNLQADVQNFETRNYAQGHDLWSVSETVVAGQGEFYQHSANLE